MKDFCSNNNSLIKEHKFVKDHNGMLFCTRCYQSKKPDDIEQVPEYVFDLLDAFLHRTPLNFQKHPVPEAIQYELNRAIEYGYLDKIPYMEDQIV